MVRSRERERVEKRVRPLKRKVQRARAGEEGKTCPTSHGDPQPTWCRVLCDCESLARYDALWLREESSQEKEKKRERRKIPANSMHYIFAV